MANRNGPARARLYCSRRWDWMEETEARPTAMGDGLAKGSVDDRDTGGPKWRRWGRRVGLVFRAHRWRMARAGDDDGASSRCGGG
ncbi:hypothetical protein E2562_026616 [Oryza meyeriana var. granulata]|uniref:Uncharacterized protein n=1 Tax=Oryza meyeriana var. granulata TaxID=110450 RepID=A0A6G1D6Z8_9ORYZ|nr:hypothetical protein E2562_026616 [Oryza meyeriana var. granulata]